MALGGHGTPEPGCDKQQQQQQQRQQQQQQQEEARNGLQPVLTPESVQ